MLNGYSARARETEARKAATSLDRQVAAPIGQGEGEEIRSAFNAISPVIRHLNTFAFYAAVMAPQRWGAEEHPTLQRDTR